MADDKKKAAEPTGADKATDTDDISQLKADFTAFASQAQQEIEALKTENVELRTRLGKLTTDTTTTATKLGVVEQLVVDREETVEELNITIAKLSKANTDKPKSKVELPNPMTIGTGKAAKTLRFAYPAIIFEGRKITAQEIADDTELATRLIAAGATILVEV